MIFVLSNCLEFLGFVIFIFQPLVQVLLICLEFVQSCCLRFKFPLSNFNSSLYLSLYLCFLVDILAVGVDVLLVLLHFYFGDLGVQQFLLVFHLVRCF